MVVVAGDRNRPCRPCACSAACLPHPSFLSLQQLATNAAAVIYGRVLAACGGGEALTPAGVLAAPLPSLRQAGLSERKASYIASLAQHFTDGHLSDARIAGGVPSCSCVRHFDLSTCPAVPPGRCRIDQAQPCKPLAAAMDEAALEAALCSVRGIGLWTCHMHAMFHLGSPDVLPTGDLGVRKGMAQLYGLEASRCL